ncbi:MAG: glycosyltransferase family 2 protein [Bacteroidota bacterium]
MKHLIHVSAEKKGLKKQIPMKHTGVVSIVAPPIGNSAKNLLPKITVITPSFNQGKFIERTIKSVLSQNYPHLEYIIVDGGSTDETLDILRKYEKHLRWISEQDTGQSSAINKGFRMATGEIVAWLNSDDTYLPNALKTVGHYFAGHPNAMMVYGEGYIIDENDKRQRRFPFTEPKFDLWKLIYYSDYILQQSTFFRRSIFDSIEMLSESLHYTMDWDLFIRIGKRFPVDYIPEYLGNIREHREAKTSTGGHKRFKEIKYIIRHHGVMLYSLAYFNYAWDTYGKRWFLVKSEGESNNVLNKICVKSKILLLTKRVLEFFFIRYQKRLQQGYYSDHWIGRNSMIVLPDYTPEVKKNLLIIEGEAWKPNVPFRLKVIINRKIARSFHVISPGAFRVKIDIPMTSKHQGCFHVEMKCNNTFVPSLLGASNDNRALAFQLRQLYLSQSENDKKAMLTDSQVDINN